MAYLALLHIFLVLPVAAKCCQVCVVDDPNDSSGLLSGQSVGEFSSRLLERFAWHKGGFHASCSICDKVHR